MKEEKHRTKISVEKKTAEELWKLKEFGETYDDVIRRLIIAYRLKGN